MRLSKPIPQPKPTPRVVERYSRRKAEANALKDAYADVDVRDGGYCWVTGRYTAPYGTSRAMDPRVRREHHHLKGRNVRPEWVDKPERIITVCKEAHDLIGAGWVVVEGCDARKPVFFHYAAHVKPKDRPFEIRGRRTQEID